MSSAFASERSSLGRRAGNTSADLAQCLQEADR